MLETHLNQISTLCNHLKDICSDNTFTILHFKESLLKAFQQNLQDPALPFALGSPVRLALPTPRLTDDEETTESE